MRPFMLVCAATLAGCLHVQTASSSPLHATDASVLAEFSRLVDDPQKIEAAAIYAEQHHLSRADTRASALASYERFMKIEAFAHAAEVAWRFGMGQASIDRPMSLQRIRAASSAAAYKEHQGQEDAAVMRLSAEYEFRNESLIGCVYSYKKSDGQDVIDDALSYLRLSGDEAALFNLLDDDCPVEPTLRDQIIDLSYNHLMFDYAIRHAAAADWIPEKKQLFILNFFASSKCGSGFQAVSVLRLPAADVVGMVERSDCEQIAISTKGWSLGQADARSYFFAAVRKQRYNLALVLLPFCGFDENGQSYVFQEALRFGHGLALTKLFNFHAGLHDAFMRYAFDQGRYRFVGTNAQTLDWQRQAFDKLVEIGQYDFAAEVAQFGFSDALRTEGIVLAFRAAMAAGDFNAGRYFLARYGPTPDRAGLVTRKMFDEEQDKWYAARAAATAGQASPAPPVTPVPRKPSPPSPKQPPCRKDDWNVTPCK
jgi:hypothetical protein